MPRKDKHLADFDAYDDGLDDFDYYDEDDEYPSTWSSRANATPAQPSGQPDALQSGIPDTSLWRCAVCTFDNTDDLSACEICGNIRHSSSIEAKEKISALAQPSILAASLFAPLPPMKLKRRSVFQKVVNRLLESNTFKEPGSFEACNPERKIESFKFDSPSPDDVILQNTVNNRSVKTSSKNTPLSQKSIHGKEAKTKFSEPVISKDKEDIDPQTFSKLRSMELHTDKEQKKSARGTIASLDSYQPENWMLEAFKQETKQRLHLAVVGHVDSGKSTLMGRILHILGVVSQKEMHKYEKEAKQQGKGSFSYAWALDESTEERARGITMTVAVAHFETPKLQVVLLDSPGHRDFVPNMISGASQADATILVVDASTGAFEAGMEGEGDGAGQTKEHTQLVRSLGVEQIIIAVNKMDVVNYSQERFNFIKATLNPFLRQCGFKDTGIKWIPLSAIENQNLVTSPSHEKLKAWYSGMCLLDAIDAFEAPIRNFGKPFRMPIAETLKSRTLGQAAVSGKIEAGAVKIGSKVLVMPNNVPATVKAIEQNGKPCTYARSGDNVDIGLQGVEPGCLIQGGVLCHPEYPVPVASVLELKIILLETSGPLLRGSQVVLHCHHAKEPAKITQLVSLLDQKGQIIPNKKLRCLLPSQRAIIEVTPERGICVEEYARYKSLGRIALRDRGKTLAVGIVTRIDEA